MNKKTVLLAIVVCLLFASLSFLLFQKKQAKLSGFVNGLYMDGWHNVVGIEWDANARMYVLEKSGKVWVVEKGMRLPEPLIDISEEVGDWAELGCLGFALDPNFLKNGYFYLSYVVDRHHLLYYGSSSYHPLANEYFNATIGRVTRFQADSASHFTRAVANSRTVLIGETKKTGMPILYLSHGVGSLVFGSDGTLLVCMGDGASYDSADEGSAPETYWQRALADSIITEEENIGAYRAQILNSLDGKLLRIDSKTGDGVSSNPFFDPAAPRAARSRIWSLGLRNPYRMCRKSGTGSTNPADGDPGSFYLGDVGWGLHEELDVVSAPGQNFGWPRFEGIYRLMRYHDDAYAPAHHERPNIDWEHGKVGGLGIVNGAIARVGSALLPGKPFTGNASTGGVWYTGDDFPPEYKNTYFHGDYVSGWIRNFVFDNQHTPLEVREFLSNIGPVVFIGTNPKKGNLYYIRYPDQIWRVTFDSSLVK